MYQMGKSIWMCGPNYGPLSGVILNLDLTTYLGLWIYLCSISVIISCWLKHIVLIITMVLLMFFQIGDLGLSKVKQHTLVSGGIRGTLPWMAPELLSGKSSMVTEKVRLHVSGMSNILFLYAIYLLPLINLLFICFHPFFFQIDIYSFGIVMWELLTGEEPYGDMHCASIIGKNSILWCLV